MSRKLSHVKEISRPNLLFPPKLDNSRGQRFPELLKQ